jgi:hypothetical protein
MKNNICVSIICKDIVNFHGTNSHFHAAKSHFHAAKSRFHAAQSQTEVALIGLRTKQIVPCGGIPIKTFNSVMLPMRRFVFLQVD